MNIADILIEALPYIRKFSRKTIVIKYGGNAMVDKDLKKKFASNITLLKYIGINPVVVHGGGPQINKVLDSMGITSKFIRGMRYTDNKTMDVVEMVLGGQVNKEIVNSINRAGGKAVGLTGKDGGLIMAEKMTICLESQDNKPPKIIDPGMVGTISKIDSSIIYTLAEKDFIPVIAPVGVDKNGNTYNINADLAASKIASAIKAARLIFLTDVDGLLDLNKNLISGINSKQIKKMIANHEIKGGMIPKMECCIEALLNGVEKTHIINGTKPHALLLELFTNSGIGTQMNQES
ncbi:MAG: acetylglutamate kinase [Desulfobacteraceae bacterium 4572_130]|nr:MAG: acetylglutamate kinase [Desulfobacteraceae bacterium 4572_130]